eukprot:TRINITY_DN6383_c0_g1_i2.p1 TRINITY_DN6383_c0_g1~~TRINITY_DN6383_c0_g1_i2.p1  ORF type:complete len:117 (+),score=30.69 TRINITY_DN6383_c0_g1_i2:204-554(+)
MKDKASIEQLKNENKQLRECYEADKERLFCSIALNIKMEKFSKSSNPMNFITPISELYDDALSKQIPQTEWFQFILDHYSSPQRKKYHTDRLVRSSNPSLSGKSKNNMKAILQTKI